MKTTLRTCLLIVVGMNTAFAEKITIKDYDQGKKTIMAGSFIAAASVSAVGTGISSLILNAGGLAGLGIIFVLPPSLTVGAAIISIPVADLISASIEESQQQQFSKMATDQYKMLKTLIPFHLKNKNLTRDSILDQVLGRIDNVKGSPNSAIGKLEVLSQFVNTAEDFVAQNDSRQATIKDILAFFSKKYGSELVQLNDNAIVSLVMHEFVLQQR